MNLGFLNELFNSIVKKQHKQVDPLARFDNYSFNALLRKLMSSTGEASGILLAQEILNRYGRFSLDEKIAFFKCLDTDYHSDVAAVRAAFAAYDKNTSSENLNVLFNAVEPPRQELLRCLNRAPNATFELVKMRADLLEIIQDFPELTAIDNDFVHLLYSWFNRGFLVMKSIDWSTPASILEKIICYEAVHEIKDWNDLRNRLEPENRRCFAFFHPAIIDEPLIFVEVALSEGIPSNIDDILNQQQSSSAKINTATFYSISNCQPGLKHISFGNFLIKQVVQELRATLPQLSQFVTLSPVPGFCNWLKTTDNDELVLQSSEYFKTLVQESFDKLPKQKTEHNLEHKIKTLAAEYFLTAKVKGFPADPVARFHLGNGAKLHQINAYADLSEKGYRQSLGVMVNYWYDLDSIEENHESYVAKGKVNCSDSITKLTKTKFD